MLNKYAKNDHKKAKDMEIFQDMLVCGRGFRYTTKNKRFRKGKSPFVNINCPPENTEVVYSNKLGNEQLFAYIDTPMQKDITIKIYSFFFYCEYDIVHLRSYQSYLLLSFVLLYSKLSLSVFVIHSLIT